MRGISKRVISLILMLVMTVGVIANGVATTYAYSSTDNAVVNALKESGYTNILYSSKDTEYATAGIAIGKSFNITSTGDIVGFLAVPEKKVVDVVATYRLASGKTSTMLNHTTTDIDWTVNDNVALLPIEFRPYQTGTLTIQFTFKENTEFLFYLGQKDGTVTETPVTVTKPAKVKVSKIVSSSTGATFTGYVTNISSNASGVEYKVYNSKNKVVCSSTTNDNELIIYGTSTKDVYYVKARAYTYDDSYNKVYGSWSDKKYFISTPTINRSATRNTIKSNSVTIKWDKVRGAKKYVVYCSTKPNSGFKKVAETTKTSAKITKFNKKTLNLKSKKYFKVVAETTKGGKTIKSEPVEVIYCQYVVY